MTNATAGTTGQNQYSFLRYRMACVGCNRRSSCLQSSHKVFVCLSISAAPQPGPLETVCVLCVCLCFLSFTVHASASLSVMAACCHCKHWIIGYIEQSSVDIQLHHRNLLEKRSICFSGFHHLSYNFTLLKKNLDIFDLIKYKIFLISVKRSGPVLVAILTTQNMKYSLHDHPHYAHYISVHMWYFQFRFNQFNTDCINCVQITTLLLGPLACSI